MKYRTIFDDKLNESGNSLAYYPDKSVRFRVVEIRDGDRIEFRAVKKTRGEDDEIEWWEEITDVAIRENLLRTAGGRLSSQLRSARESIQYQQKRLMDRETSTRSTLLELAKKVTFTLLLIIAGCSQAPADPPTRCKVEKRLSSPCLYAIGQTVTCGDPDGRNLTWFRGSCADGGPPCRTGESCWAKDDFSGMMEGVCE